MKFSELRLILTCQCEQASYLISESLDRDLTFGERCALRLHKFVCHNCRRFMKQLRWMHALFAETPAAFQQRVASHCCQLSPARKAQILKAMRKASS